MFMIIMLWVVDGYWNVGRLRSTEIVELGRKVDRLVWSPFCCPICLPPLCSCRHWLRMIRGGGLGEGNLILFLTLSTCLPSSATLLKASHNLNWFVVIIPPPLLGESFLIITILLLRCCWWRWWSQDWHKFKCYYFEIEDWTAQSCFPYEYAIKTESVSCTGWGLLLLKYFTLCCVRLWIEEEL